MVITRQDRNIIIEASDSINMGAVQKVIDYINILEIVAKNQGSEEQASDLAELVNKSWWSENKSRFLP
ncbi:hypothetical protein [Dyadobacter chenhuakuii]|jgi:hypothetical protein|uniref:Uncharacterized protein n=2 Tax=Dyadobacter TaxID=120831 RepID=A0A9X1TUC9_9BACT|nr:hypothetical protein [Dyadobacter chenhuakuii]MCF2493196.1 hypothetical protein [Dyadobacter chenhuakuii]MCF2499268.1 hypothetical protein [Dyadobacter chenhuakuii]USJ32520.1 hypothetical protein NFI80_07190 [Dyadobacter chenhuakuii]